MLLISLPMLAKAQDSLSVDHHEHLLSPALVGTLGQQKPFVASDLIAELDQAGIQRAVLLSLAYQFGNPNRPPVHDEYAKVKTENDWTASQAREYPNRLFVFCGVDPLREYALTEIARCSHDAQLRLGLKLHFANSDVDLDNLEHLRKLQEVFRAADQHHMAIVVHLHPSVNRHRPYGQKEAMIFLSQVLPYAPHVCVQIAHLSGPGGYDDLATDQALSVFIEAIARHDKRVAHLYFDISGVAGIGKWREKKQLIASRIRQVGVHRILFGSDGAWTDFTPLRAEQAFHALPLTPEEMHVIETNVAPYLRAAIEKSSATK